MVDGKAVVVMAGVAMVVAGVLEGGIWFFRPTEDTLSTYFDTGDGNSTNTRVSNEREGEPMAERATLVAAELVMVKVKGDERD